MSQIITYSNFLSQNISSLAINSSLPNTWLCAKGYSKVSYCVVLSVSCNMHVVGLVNVQVLGASKWSMLMKKVKQGIHMQWTGNGKGQARASLDWGTKSWRMSCVPVRLTLGTSPVLGTWIASVHGWWGDVRALTMQDSITESKTLNYILFMVFCWCGSIFIEERGRKNKTPSLI